jgi:SOS regulatory protein LexA
MNPMDIKDAANIIRKFYKTQKRLPSYGEMTTLFGFGSKRTSFTLAKRLIEAGYMSKEENGKLVPGPSLTALPVLGSIQAGHPTTANQFFYGNITLEDYIVARPDKSYILKVTGDSMINAGINPEDLVIVEVDSHPQNGNIVVANIDGEFTLKYFDKTPEGGVRLVAANDKYPAFYPKESLSVVGVVVAVIRRYN